MSAMHHTVPYIPHALQYTTRVVESAYPKCYKQCRVLHTVGCGRLAGRGITGGGWGGQTPMLFSPHCPIFAVQGVYKKTNAMLCIRAKVSPNYARYAGKMALVCF